MEWCEGKTQLPGIYPEVYAVAKRDIVTWPTRTTTITTGMSDIAKYTGNFVLAALAFFRKVGVIVDKSPITAVSQGSKPSKTFLNTGVFMHQGVDEDATGFAQQANNDDLVFIFKTKNGKYRVLGNEMFQSDTSISQNLGGAVTDEMGTTITVTVSDISPAPFYDGEIVTEDGIINDQTP